MPRLHSVAILALSLFIFALSLSAAVLGRPRDSIYAVPGRIDAADAR